MSKLYDFRSDLAAAIVAADIGWTADTIIILRQGDLWNAVATAINGSGNGAVLHIGIAEGKASEEAGLEMDITVPLTILCLPQVEPDAKPEEDLWEALVKFVHDLRLNGEPWAYRFKIKSFSDIEVQTDGGTGYLGRQTSFTKHLSL